MDGRAVRGVGVFEVSLCRRVHAWEGCWKGGVEVLGGRAEGFGEGVGGFREGELGVPKRGVKLIERTYITELS